MHLWDKFNGAFVQHMELRDKGEEIESNAFISRMSILYKEFKDAYNAFSDERLLFRSNMLYKELFKYNE